MILIILISIATALCTFALLELNYWRPRRAFRAELTATHDDLYKAIARIKDWNHNGAGDLEAIKKNYYFWQKEHARLRSGSYKWVQPSQHFVSGKLEILQKQADTILLLSPIKNA